MRPRKRDRHLPPCVYFKHGTHWYVKAGKWVALGERVPDALAAYGRLVAAPTGGMVALLDEVFNQGAWAENTRLQYRYAANVLKRKLAAFSPEQVKSKHVAAIKQSMRKTPNMANRVLSFLRLTFAYAVENQRVDSNPCIGIKRLPEAKRKRFLTDAEWRAIYAHAGPRLQIIMRLQWLTGQRINDVLTIRRSQITKAGLEFEQEKTGAKLTVRWSPELRSAVDDALTLLGEAPTLTLFRSTSGKPPDYRSVHRQWTDACLKAGVEDARPNDQRAKSLTETKRQGKDATALAGHTTEAMTERYLRDREIPEVDGPSIRQVLDVGQKGQRKQ